MTIISERTVQATDAIGEQHTLTFGECSHTGDFWTVIDHTAEIIIRPRDGSFVYHYDGTYGRISGQCDTFEDAVASAVGEHGP